MSNNKVVCERCKQTHVEFSRQWYACMEIIRGEAYSRRERR